MLNASPREMRLSPLTENEKKVMSCFWMDNKSLSVSEVRDRLTYPIINSTLYNIFEKLEQKGFLSTSGHAGKENNYARVFQPLISAEEYCIYSWSGFYHGRVSEEALLNLISTSISMYQDTKGPVTGEKRISDMMKLVSAWEDQD